MTLFDLITAALQEDLPEGDLTTDSLSLAERMGRARLVAKQDLFLSGTSAFEQTVLMLEPQAKIKWHFQEGDSVLKGQIVCTIQGNLIQILKAERTALNFIMHFSGIATLTNQFVVAAGFHTKILDTRKTLPGYRQLEKRAVLHGGGTNHRMDLSSAIMIKDNHIAVAGGIENAVNQVRARSQAPIEVEASNLEDVKICVKLGVSRILLDNMNNEMLEQALVLIPKEIETEASGNMSLERIPSVAKLGVTFISVGALTHSAPAADFSLQFLWNETL